MSTIPFRTAREIRDAVSGRSVSAVQVVRARAGHDRCGQSEAERVSDGGSRPRARTRASDRSRRAHRTARRRAGRAQGQHPDPRRHHDSLVAHASAIRSTLRCDGRDASRGGGRHRDRQDQLRRVRHGLVHRELGVRTVAQSVESGSHFGRLERRIGGRGRLGYVADRTRVGHRRLDPAAGLSVRRRRPEADLRPRFAVRLDRVCFVARSDRSDGAHDVRCRDGACRSCGSRPARLDGFSGTRRRLCWRD